MTAVREVVAQLVKRLLTALAETFTWTGVRTLLKDAAVGAVTGAGISMVQDLAIEEYQVKEGVRSGIDLGQVFEIGVGAVVGGAVGSVAHGLLSKTLGESTNIGAKALKGAVTHFSVGTVGNVAGAGATGGGLDAADIFGGAGGGAISGGVHGASEHPDSGAHGEKGASPDANGASLDTNGASSDAKGAFPDANGGSHGDDATNGEVLLNGGRFGASDASGGSFTPNRADPDSEPANQGGGPQNGTNGHPSPVDESPAGSQTPVDTSASVSALSRQDAPAGARGGTSTIDSLAPAATASSSPRDTLAAQNGNPFSDNEHGVTGNGPQPAESEQGSGNSPQRGAPPVEAASGNHADIAQSPSSTTASTSETAFAGNQSSATRGSQSGVANSPRLDAESASSAPEGRAGASPPATNNAEGQSRPTQAGGPNQPSASASARPRASSPGPPAVARTADNAAAQSVRHSVAQPGPDPARTQQQEQHDSAVAPVDGGSVVAAGGDRSLAVSGPESVSAVDGGSVAAAVRSNEPGGTLVSNEPVASDERLAGSQSGKSLSGTGAGDGRSLVALDPPRSVLRGVPAADLASDRSVEDTDRAAPSTASSVETTGSGGKGNGPGRATAAGGGRGSDEPGGPARSSGEPRPGSVGSARSGSEAAQSGPRGRPLSAPPTDKPLLAAIPLSRTTIREIEGWIGDVNHDGDTTVAPSGARLMNCGPATLVVFDRLSGIPSNARAHLAELTPDDVGEATGLPLVPTTRDGIAQKLIDEGPGAHTVVAIRYHKGEQHSFNAYFDGENVYALDGQHGTLEPWPPNLDRAGNAVQAWFMGTPFHGDQPIFSRPDARSGPQQTDDAQQPKVTQPQVTRSTVTGPQDAEPTVPPTVERQDAEPTGPQTVARQDAERTGQ